MGTEAAPGAGVAAVADQVDDFVAVEETVELATPFKLLALTGEDSSESVTSRSSSQSGKLTPLFFIVIMLCRMIR